MNIISLNTWGGRAGKELLLDFFHRHKNGTDVFCLQEIWSAPYPQHDGDTVGGRILRHDNAMHYGLQEISALLTEHAPFFSPLYLDDYGLLTLIRKDIKVLSHGDRFVYREKGFIPTGDVGTHARCVQSVTVESSGRPLTILNFHGLWNGKGKTDAPERIQQSENIVRFLSELPGEIFFCGDFNLLPDTESLKMIERFGLRNLIKDFHITSTRTSLYDKTTDLIADYVLVSPDIPISEFRVLPDVVSDHAPLSITIR